MITPLRHLHSLVSLLLLTGCDPPVTPPQGSTEVLLSASIVSVNVSPATLTLFVGDEATLTASVTATPGAVTSYNSIWSTGDIAIASVSRTAVGITQVVTARSVGTTTITAASAMNPGVSGSATVRVIAR